MLVTGIERALSPAEGTLRRNVEEVAREARSAPVVMARQATELTRDATGRQDVPAHFDRTGRGAQTAVVDGEGAIVANAVVVGVGAKVGRTGQDALSPMEVGVGHAGQALQHRLIFVVTSIAARASAVLRQADRIDVFEERELGSV